jgi:anti-sigma factor RsiW
MSDCLNVEIRELLPEYLGGTLSASRRAEVDAHVASCAECADELAVLRLVREAYAESPAVNVKAIVAALPRKSARATIRTVQAAAPVGRSWRQHAFQIAAVVSFIALGGISLAVARSFFDGNPSAVAPDTLVAVNAETPAISFAGGVSDLGDEDLEALLSALEEIEALPVTETADPPLAGTGRQGS